MWSRLNETTFSAIFYFIKISVQYMNWGGKCSPERLMQFSYFTWTTASLPHYSWETALMPHSTQQFTGFQWGGVGLQTWHCFLAVSKGHFSIWRVPSIQSLNYCHLEGNRLKPTVSQGLTVLLDTNSGLSCSVGHVIVKIMLGTLIAQYWRQKKHWSNVHRYWSEHCNEEWSLKLSLILWLISV